MHRPDGETLADPAIANGERSFRPLRQQAERLKGALDQTIDQQLRSARRSVRRTQHAAEDLADNLRLQTRRDPIRTLGIALLAGALVGLVLGWTARSAPRK